MKIKNIKEKIRTIPDWPKHGVMFRDITTLLKEPEAFHDVIKRFVKRYKKSNITKVVGVESRGFIFGSVVAHELGVGFVPARKPGKLPAKATKVEYSLEYGKDALEIHDDAISQGDNVLIIDDLVATSGTCLATAEIIKKLGGNVIECAFLVELPNLGGRNKLESNGYKVFSLIPFEGD